MYHNVLIGLYPINKYKMSKPFKHKLIRDNNFDSKRTQFFKRRKFKHSISDVIISFILKTVIELYSM